MAHAPALGLTPPNLCVHRGVPDPSAGLASGELERVRLARRSPLGRREGAAESWVAARAPPSPASSSQRGPANKGERRPATGNRCAGARPSPSEWHSALPGWAFPPRLAATHLTSWNDGDARPGGRRSAHTSSSSTPARTRETGPRCRRICPDLWLLLAPWLPSVTPF